MTEFNLLGKKLLVELPLEVHGEVLTEGGIILPESAIREDETLRNVLDALGTVLAVGDKVIGISVGDKVLCNPTLEYMPITHPDSKRGCVFMMEDNVLSVVTIK